MISTNLRIVAIAGSLALLIFIVELLRRRRLKEEYSVLWIATALMLLLLAAWGGLLRDLTHMIGAISQASTLYFFGLLFVVFMLLHFSVRVSNLERRVIVLLQEVALLDERSRRAEGDGESPSASSRDPAGEDDGALLPGVNERERASTASSPLSARARRACREGEDPQALNRASTAI